MIITNNEELLRTPCEPVLPEEVGELVEKLENELALSGRLGRPGIGLAAPQIGIWKKIAIIRIEGVQKINLVNANIANGYKQIIFRDEGCLSFPGRIEVTKRWSEVHIENNLVAPYGFVGTGILAIACQHELDHLNGILMMDESRRVVEKIKNKIGPNSPCFCGSNKKYKKCHGLEKK